MISSPRALVAGAAVVLIAAGILLEGREADPDPRPAEPGPAVTAALSSTPTADTSPPPELDVDRVAMRAATDYTLAATNWSPATYAAACRRQARLATGALRRRLVSTPPSQVQLRQLRRDTVSHLSAVLGVRMVHASPIRAAVRISVDEFHTGAGRRVQSVARYRVELRQRAGSWRVVSFTAVRRTR